MSEKIPHLVDRHDGGTLQQVLDDHLKWVRGEIGEARADLTGEAQLAIRAACNEAARSATSAYVQGIANGYDRSDAVIAALFQQYSGTTALGDGR